MGLLSRFRGTSLHPAWHYPAHGTLWQVQVGSPRFLLGESREEGSKSVTFFSIERESGKVHWEGINPVGSWWAGVEGVFGGVVLFHGFATPDLPIHKGIFAVEGEKGTLLWSEPELRFLSCKEGIVAARPMAGESPEKILLDLNDGRVITDPAAHASIPSSVPAGDLPAEFPRSLDRFSEADPAAVAALRQAVPSNAVTGSVAAIISADYCIVEYGVEITLAKPRAFRILLSIIDWRSGRKLFESTLLSDAPSAQPEPFFVQDGVLYYVSGRSSLSAVPFGTT